MVVGDHRKDAVSVGPAAACAPIGKRATALEDGRGLTTSAASSRRDSPLW
jgi:hypothetical protein